jgi:hypothetical protein
MPDTSEPPDFPRSTVTVTELARALDLTVFAVHYHIKQGHIPTERVGNMHLIPRPAARRIVANYHRNKRWL